MYVCTYVRTYVRMYVCMYVCMYVYNIYIYIYKTLQTNANYGCLRLQHVRLTMPTR